MKNKYAKWLIGVLAIALVLVTILSTVVYIVDPFFQFRVKDDKYLINVRFACGGLIKNYDYDALILGSSMTQNFDMDVFREVQGVNPLHIGIGGLEYEEELELLDLAYDAGRADKYFLSAELYMFTDDAKKSRLPQYLLKDDLISRCRYFLNYEAWFRFVPIDLGLSLLDAAGIKVPAELKKKTSIDNMENWEADFKFGEDVVVGNFKKGSYNVSDVETDGLYNKMVKKIDVYFEKLQLDQGEHILFFPPYSMLYWSSRSDELFDILAAGKKYYIEKALEKGIKVYDFQAADFTSDLNNYKDLTHYKGEINDWMTEQFSSDEYLLTEENYTEFLSALEAKRNDFKHDRADLFGG